MLRFSRFSSSYALLLVVPLVLLFSGCKVRFIQNTSVPDTIENRAVMDFLKKYKEATESRSVKDVMELVATDYFENGTRFESNDKYGYAQLSEKLTRTFEKVEALNLSFYVQNIERDADRIKVVYYFLERALIKYPTESKWMSVNDVNQMVLRVKGRQPKEGFEILSGL